MAGRAHPSSEARPKRAGDDFAREHDDTAKKPRFDYRNPSTLAAEAPEEDVVLNADVIGKSGPQIKRNAVNIDGYESDSDNDNFNARAEERARRNEGATKAGSKDEDEDDMFADMEEEVQGTRDGDEDEDLAREGKKRKKDVRFMEQDEIEGQVMNSKSGGHVSADLLLGKNGKQRQRSASVSSSSGDDEERDLLPDEMEDDLAAEIGAGGKKKHAPRLDAFNLKDEEDEGRFDQSGNYVRNAMDPDEAHDNWLNGLSKSDIRRAKEAQEKREEERKRKALESDAVVTSDCLSKLLQHLQSGETAMEALQRLEKAKPREAKKVPSWQQKKKQKNKMDLDEPEGNGTGDTAEEAHAKKVEQKRKKAIDAITDAATAIQSRAGFEIYEAPREKLLRQYKSETGEDWKPTGADTDEEWQFRWRNADDEPVHGPYDAATMKAWKEGGYFAQVDGVEYRRVGEADWSLLLDV